MSHNEPDELLEFPCSYEFKVFGDADQEGRFLSAVQAAISTITPVSRDAMRVRQSSGGKYQCVTVAVLLQNSQQLKSIYAVLRGLDGLRYLL